jgi:endonuclease/exonuclease/phosphatase family metal-dependent hydrolase
MRRGLAGILLVMVLFSMIAIIPKGYSQLNIKFDYLVDNSSKTIEVNLTAPVYITNIPIQVYDSEGKLLLQREVAQYFTKRIEKTRFNRFVLNIDMPEKLPVSMVLFPNSTLERSYTLIAPQIDIDLKNRNVMVYLAKNSTYNLTVANGDASKKYSVLAEEDGWHSVHIGDASEELLSPGTAFYSTIAFPGGLSTSVTRYIPRIVVDAGKGYVRIKGWGISGKLPRISVYNSANNYKSRIEGVVHFKEGEFVFQDSFEGTKREIRDGDKLVYREGDHYRFQFDIPYFFAMYSHKDNSIKGTVSRGGRVAFQYGSRMLEAIPDNRGRFKITLQGPPDIPKLINIKGGYISPSGNEYWKKFNWGNAFKLSPLDNSTEIDLKVMSYNIHHAISIDGKIDIDEIARIIEESGAQIVGLQEVDKRFIRTLFVDQAKKLAEKLDMYYYFGDTLNILGAEYGNAILSKFPIKSVSNLQLDSKGEQRGIISAKIDINGKEINFLVTHLSLNRAVRNTQIQQLKRYLGLLENEVILVGDFNSTPQDGEIMLIERELREVVKELGNRKIYTFRKLDGSKVQIDYIFVSPEVTASQVYTINSRASDHLPLVAYIRIKDI